MPHDLVVRPRLIELIAGALSGRVTTVTAPAGYGKTALLADWTRQTDQTVAWLSLDEGDNTGTTLLDGIQAALLGAHFSRATLPSPAYSEESSTQRRLEQLLLRLESLPSTILILDDCHLLSEGVTQEVLSRLVRRAPESLHLILSGRHLPLALELARLRAGGLVSAISARQLCFTENEAERLLNEKFSLELSGPQLNTLHARTSGWCTGLRLIGLSVRESDDRGALIQRIRTVSTGIGDYLLEEVFSRQPTEVQEFLFATCLPERIHPSLCEFLTGRGDSEAILERLSRLGLFLSRTDAESAWYSYHPIFLEFLRRELSARHPDRVRELYNRCSAWYEASGFMAECIECALAAGEHARAGRLIAGICLGFILSGPRQRLAEWIERVHSVRRHQRRWLAISRAWALLFEGALDCVPLALDDAVRIIRQRAREGADRAGTVRLMGHVRAIACLLAGWQGRAEASIRHSARAIPKLAPADYLVRCAVVVSNSLHLRPDRRMELDLETTGEELLKAIRNSRSRGMVEAALAVLYLRADLEMASGRLRKAKRTFEEARRLAEREQALPTVIAGIGYAGYADLLYESGELIAAERECQRCIQLARERQDTTTLCQAQSVLARVAAARGDTLAAGQYLDMAEDLARCSEIAWLVSKVTAWRVRLWLRGGQIGRALAWLAAFDLEPGGQVGFRREDEYLAVVRIRIAQTRADAALEMLEWLRPLVDETGFGAALLEIDLLRAVAYELRDQREIALECLAAALTKGEPEGFLRSFLDMGMLLTPLLNAATRKRIHPQYAGRLLELVAAQSEVRPRIGNAVLTQRESEVLELVMAGLENKVIAEKLEIAYNTVKRHLHNIFSKCEVGSRAELIASVHNRPLDP